MRLSDPAPWGRPPLPDVPVPPLADADALAAFVRALAVHVAALSDTGAVGAADVALLSLLEDEYQAHRWTREPWPRPLPPTTLRVAVLTYFPAPWTPHGLATALDEAGLPRGQRWWRTAPDVVGWGGDPDVTARRGPGGDWVVHRHERGSTTVYATPATDDDMVLLLMSEVRGHPFPLGRSLDGTPVDALVAAAEPVRSGWSEHARLPYLRTWARRLAEARSATS